MPLIGFGDDSEESRMQAAIEEYVRGKHPLWIYIKEGRVRRQKNHYHISATERRPCCTPIVQDGGSIPAHLSSAKHIANKHRVDRLELLSRAGQIFVQARNDPYGTRRIG